jgi:predicted MFS family arabinose efflux permease
MHPPMRTDSAAPRDDRREPPGAWRIATIGLFASMVSGTVWGSFGLFLVVIESDTGWSKTTISLAFSIFTLAGSFAVPVIGVAIDRWGTRSVLGTLGVIMALGLAGGAAAPSPPVFYLLFGIIGGVGIQCAGSYALFTIAANWFRYRRATAMAVVDSGSGIGTFISLPVLQAITDAWGWRGGYLALAALALLILAPLGTMLPLHPPGGGSEDRARESPSLAAGFLQLVRSPLLRAMAVIYFVAPLVFHAINTHQIAYMQEGGVDADRTVWIVSATGLTFFLARVVLGMMIDRTGLLRAEILIAICAAVSFVMLIALAHSRTEFLAYLYPLLFGLGFSSTGIIFTATTRAMVEASAFPLIYGTLRLIYGFGVALGAPFVAAIVDTTGSYDTAMIVVGLMLLAHHAIYLAMLRRR